MIRAEPTARVEEAIHSRERGETRGRSSRGNERKFAGVVEG